MNGKLLEKPRWSKGLNFFSPCLARREEIHLSQDKTMFCLDSSRTLFGLSAAEATWRGKL